MRKREEIEAEMKHWAEKDSDREYAFAEWKLILETMLDLRDQNEKILAFLSIIEQVARRHA
jgi:hypothetical protein